MAKGYDDLWKMSDETLFPSTRSGLRAESIWRRYGYRAAFHIPIFMLDGLVVFAVLSLARSNDSPCKSVAYIRCENSHMARLMSLPLNFLPSTCLRCSFSRSNGLQQFIGAILPQRKVVVCWSSQRPMVKSISTSNHIDIDFPSSET